MPLLINIFSISETYQKGFQFLSDRIVINLGLVEKDNFMETFCQEESSRGISFGEIEAVKTVSELFAPISGTITMINESLEETPEKINQDCYGEGWLIKIRPKTPLEKENLLTSVQYSELIN